jgi:hypothetical protein
MENTVGRILMPRPVVELIFLVLARVVGEPVTELVKA